MLCPVYFLTGLFLSFIPDSSFIAFLKGHSLRNSPFILSHNEVFQWILIRMHLQIFRVFCIDIIYTHDNIYCIYTLESLL